MIRCPHCSQTRFRRARFRWVNVLYSFLLRRRYKCRVCLGYFSKPLWIDDGLAEDEEEWEEEDEPTSFFPRSNP